MTDALVVRYTRWEDVRGQSARQGALPWPDFVRRLELVPAQEVKADSPLLKLATFGDVRTERGSLRSDANVLEVGGLEGDYDGGEVTPEDAVARLEQHHIRAVVVTTWSHTPDTPR